MAKVRKTCSFYVSEWHLITMLLPHVNKAINEGISITTILEEDSSNKVKILLSKLRLKNERQISRINWSQTVDTKEKIEQIFEHGSKRSIDIIISGSNEYINRVNNEINTYLLNVNSDNINVKIINCYYVEGTDIKEILKKHDSILNTGGEKSKEDFLASIKHA